MSPEMTCIPTQSEPSDHDNQPENVDTDEQMHQKMLGWSSDPSVTEPQFETISRDEYYRCIMHHENVMRYYKLFDNVVQILKETETDQLRYPPVSKSDTDALIQMVKNWKSTVIKSFRKQQDVLDELDPDKLVEMMDKIRIRDKEITEKLTDAVYRHIHRIHNYKQRNLTLSKELAEVTFGEEYAEKEPNEQNFLENLQSKVKSTVKQLNSSFKESLNNSPSNILESTLEQNFEDEVDEEQTETETGGVDFLLEESMQDVPHEKIEWLPFLLEDMFFNHVQVAYVSDFEGVLSMQLSDLKIAESKLLEEIKLLNQKMNMQEIIYHDKSEEVKELEEDVDGRTLFGGLQTIIQAGAKNLKSKLMKLIK